MNKKKVKAVKQVSEEAQTEILRKEIERAYHVFKDLVLSVSAKGYETRIQKDATVILVKIVGTVLEDKK